MNRRIRYVLGLFLWHVLAGVAGAACARPDYAFDPGAASLIADAGIEDAPPADTGRPPDLLPEAGSLPPDAAPPDAAPPPCKSTEVTVTTNGVTHCYFFTLGIVPCVGACGTDPRTHLVTFEQAAEFTSVLAAVEPFRGAPRYWIGLHAKNGVSATKPENFEWVTKTPNTLDQWQTGFPNGAGACVLEDTTTASAKGTKPSWLDHDPADPRIALCEREP